MDNQKRKDVVYQYKDGSGKVVFEKIVRTENGTTTIYWNDKKTKWVRNFNELDCEKFLYNYERIPGKAVVVILSDEQEVDTFNDSLKTIDNTDAIATCIPNNVWNDVYAIPLIGKIIPILLRYNEKKFARLLATRLYSHETEIKIVDLPFKSVGEAEFKNFGVYDWWYTQHEGNGPDLRRILGETPSIDAEQRKLLGGEDSIIDIFLNPKNYEKEYIFNRIEAIHSQEFKEKILTKLAEDLGEKPETLINEFNVITERKSKPRETQEEASELRLKGLVDIGLDLKTKKKVYIIFNEKRELKVVPYLDGYNEYGQKVRFIPPQRISFTLPTAKEVMEHYERDDASLFEDLMDASREYVFIGEIDRLICVSTVFTSYIIHHEDIHYLPILLMCSGPNHGKSHVLKFTANTGYRGKWWRSFNLPACIRYNDEFQSIICLDVWDFAKSLKTQDHMDFVLGKIEKGSTIPKVNRPSAQRYDQHDEYDPYGLLMVGSNYHVPGNYEALKTRILPIRNVLATDTANIKKPDNPQIFLPFRNRLTAWKARVMHKRLKVRAHIRLEGRLFDMGEAFLQVLNEVYPKGYDMMVDYLRNLERQRLMEKSESGEAIVISIINRLFLEESAVNLMKHSERQKVVPISQRRLIDEVQKVLPQLTSRGIMGMFRDTFGFTGEPVKLSYDYLHRIDAEKLESLLTRYGLKEKDAPVKIEIPDTPEELLKKDS